MTPAHQPQPQRKKANDPATLRCDNEPCLFHHLGICRFSCHQWEPIRSRPHTSTPAPDRRVPYIECNHSYSSCPINWDAHNKTIAKASREQVLDAIWGYMTEHGVEKRPKGYYLVSGTFSLGGFVKYLESLRGGATQQGGERR